MLENVHWLGHACFKIVGEKIVYIDPYQIQEGETADIILITHDHYDHLSVGGTYTMTAEEGAQAAKDIQPKVVVPMHWGSIVGSRSDAERFEALCDCEVRIFEKEG